MTEEIKTRIELMKKGELPGGYARKRELVYPLDWGNPVSLNTVLMENKDRNEEGVYSKDDVLSVSGEYGVVNQIGLLGRSYAGASVANYHVVETGDVVYTKSPLKQNPYGIIKLNKGAPGIVSTLYAVYHCDNIITGKYLDFYFSVDTNLNNYLNPLVKKGAKNDMKVNNGDVIKGLIALPSLPEQQKIAEILTTCDKLIGLQQCKIKEIKALKKTYLSKMFPNQGNSVPEIRFPGFTHAWEQRKLGDIASFAKGSGYSKNDLTNQGTPIILYGRLYTKYQTKIDNVDTFVVAKSGSVYSTGNEVIVPASGETPEDIARASAVVKSGVLLGGDLNIVHPDERVEPTFLALSISNGEQQKALAKKAQGKSIVHLHNTDLENVEIFYPTRTEQERIVRFFTDLDNLITLHQRELEEREKYKKALMQLLLTGIVRVKPLTTTIEGGGVYAKPHNI